MPSAQTARASAKWHLVSALAAIIRDYSGPFRDTAVTLRENNIRVRIRSVIVIESNLVRDVTRKGVALSLPNYAKTIEEAGLVIHKLKYK